MTAEESKQWQKSDVYLEAYQKYVEDFEAREAGTDGLDGATLMTRLARRDIDAREKKEKETKIKAE